MNDRVARKVKDPYEKTAAFEDTDEEDIIRVTTRPVEASFDPSGDETITLIEQDPDEARYVDPDAAPYVKGTDGVIGTGTLSIEDILAEAEAFARDHREKFESESWPEDRTCE